MNTQQPEREDLAKVRRTFALTLTDLRANGPADTRIAFHSAFIGWWKSHKVGTSDVDRAVQEGREILWSFDIST